SALFLAAFSPQSFSKSPPPPVPPEIETAKAEPSLQWQFERDADGRIVCVVDPAGRWTKLHYELEQKRVRRLVKELSDGTKVVLEFDKLGRRTSRSDATGTVCYEYDSFNRLKAIRRDKGLGLEYTYDTLGRVSSFKLGKELTVAYAYDF